MTTTLRAAAEQALRALTSHGVSMSEDDTITKDAITTLRTALEQPAPEPVAYFDPQERGFYWAIPTQITGVPVTVKVDPIALYTHPFDAEQRVKELEQAYEAANEGRNYANQLLEAQSKKVYNLERGMAKAIAAEREACAKICEDEAEGWRAADAEGSESLAYEDRALERAAAVIRERSNVEVMGRASAACEGPLDCRVGRHGGKPPYCQRRV